MASQEEYNIQIHNKNRGADYDQTIIDQYEAQQQSGQIGATDTAAQLFAVEPNQFTVPEKLRDIVEYDYDTKEPSWKLNEDFGSLDANPWVSTGQYDVLEGILNVLDANSPYRDLLLRKMNLAKEGQQLSSSDFLINRLKNQNNLGLASPSKWTQHPGVQVASMGNLNNLGIDWNNINPPTVMNTNQGGGGTGQTGGFAGSGFTPPTTGQTGGFAGSGFSPPPPPPPRGPDLRNRANGGIISLWQR
jgi:hypothetical protein